MLLLTGLRIIRCFSAISLSLSVEDRDALSSTLTTSSSNCCKRLEISAWCCTSVPSHSSSHSSVMRRNSCTSSWTCDIASGAYKQKHSHSFWRNVELKITLQRSGIRVIAELIKSSLSATWIWSSYTGWRTKCHNIDCSRNTFLLLQKYLTSCTELILIGWKIVPNEEHVQCDHRFASQPLANKPLHSSQVFRKHMAQLHYVGPPLETR